MSSIKLTADSGGGTVAIKAPASTTGNAALEFTVPSTSSGTLATTNGITAAQQFRLIANQTGSGSTGTVLTNWEEVDTDYQAIGSNWSQSSGIFSCSATGIYMCLWTLVINGSTSGDAFDPNVAISTDSGSNYTSRSKAWAHVDSTEPKRFSPGNHFIFDVANTSTFRLSYRQSDTNSITSNTTIVGSSTESTTNIMFIRLGDT